VREAMLSAARESGATVVTDVFHQFNPHGVSGVVVIAESHIAIHTWPEHGFAAVDVFTCGKSIDITVIRSILQDAFQASDVSERAFARGIGISSAVKSSEHDGSTFSSLSR
jgi:S-adenosylmethionine decarboxylase